MVALLVIKLAFSMAVMMVAKKGWKLVENLGTRLGYMTDEMSVAVTELLTAVQLVAERVLLMALMWEM